MLYRSGDSWLAYPVITDEELNSVCLLSETKVGLLVPWHYSSAERGTMAKG
jgi:hypothetical protein